jgi:hypothetical protein
MSYYWANVPELRHTIPASSSALLGPVGEATAGGQGGRVLGAVDPARVQAVGRRTGRSPGRIPVSSVQRARLQRYGASPPAWPAPQAATAIAKKRPEDLPG